MKFILVDNVPYWTAYSKLELVWLVVTHERFPISFADYRTQWVRFARKSYRTLQTSRKRSSECLREDWSIWRDYCLIYATRARTAFISTSTRLPWVSTLSTSDFLRDWRATLQSSHCHELSSLKKRKWWQFDGYSMKTIFNSKMTFARRQIRRVLSSNILFLEAKSTERKCNKIDRSSIETSLYVEHTFSAFWSHD